MSNLIPFDLNNIPAHIKRSGHTLNSDLTAHSSPSGYPTISIKGKVFAVRRDGVRTIIPNPRDPESAATSIDVVMLKVNPDKSKVYYATGWREGDEAKPTCFSNNGRQPDPSVEAPQAKNCATCKHNQWGSKISDSGTKLKSCSDAVRMAIAPSDKLHDPMLLRVPPASIKALSEYGHELSPRGVEYNAVVTRISFDAAASTPRLKFKAIGFLPDDVLAKVHTAIESEEVDAIINGGGGVSGSPDTERLEPPTLSEQVITKASGKKSEATSDDIDAEIAKALAGNMDEEEETEVVVKKAKPAAKPKALASKEISLDDLDFDD